MRSTPLVTRFAPSPTGHLHLGNARTALLNFLAARQAHGQFIVRVEDTDESRGSEEFIQDLFQDLRWLGIEWDEGPDIGGPQFAYRYQQRRQIHEDWLAKLDAAGLTYPCFCTPAELNVARKQSRAAGTPPRYAGTCRALSAEQRAERLVSGKAAALRFRVPPGRTVSFVDAVYGEQRFDTDDIGDFVIRRADGSTAPFFCNAIDDALMGVTLVLRGDDHLSNTPRQMLVLESLGLPVPVYAHVALLQAMDGANLSKRHGDLSLRDLRRRGFLPNAILNHLVRLGHTCMTDGWLDQAAMQEQFSLDRLGRAAAKFDETQLRHWQREAVARLSAADFLVWISGQLPTGVETATLAQFSAAIRHNVELPSDARMWVDVVFGSLGDLAQDALGVVRAAGPGFFAIAHDVASRGVRDLGELGREIGRRSNQAGPALYMPLRAALTGTLHGPELGSLLALINTHEIIARLERARRLAS